MKKQTKKSNSFLDQNRGLGTLVDKVTTLDRLEASISISFKTAMSRPLCFLALIESSERLIFIDKDRKISLYKITMSAGVLSLCPDETFDQDRLTVPVAHDITLSHHLFAVTRDGKCLFTCGHWDNTFKMNSLEAKRLTTSFLAHNG